MIVPQEAVRLPWELADGIGTSPDTAARMVKSLLARKIVAAYTIQYDHRAVGYEKYICFISTGAATMELSKAILNFCANCKNITYLIQGIGAYNYIIGISARGHDELTEVLDRIDEVLKDSRVRVDPMFVKDVWYGERILASSAGPVCGAPDGAGERRKPPLPPEGTPTLMEYYKK